MPPPIPHLNFSWLFQSLSCFLSPPDFFPFPMSETSFPFSFLWFSFLLFVFLSCLLQAGRTGQNSALITCQEWLKLSWRQPLQLQIAHLWIRSIPRKESIHVFWLEMLKPEKDEDGFGRDLVSSIIFWTFTSFCKVIWFSGSLKQHLQPYLGWKHDISLGNLVSDMACLLTVYFYEWHCST